MTQKKKDLTFEENHAKLYADMINYEEQANMGMMDEAIKESVAMKATLKQVCVNHYKDCKIQPVEFIVGNDLTFLEGNIIKYITRHRRKGEGRKDIEKVIHYAEMILEMEYNEQ